MEAKLQPSLSNKSVWLIDDSIPLERADFDKELMLSGQCPIDRGALLALLSRLEEEHWRDKAVRALCDELTKEAGEISAFRQPASALAYLRTGAKAPDVMVFDMEYESVPDQKLIQEYLGAILEECMSVVQIYSVQASENIAPRLEPLTKKYPTRLQTPLQKAQINAEKLAIILSQKLEASLSAQLALNVRRLSTLAIENVLVQIDELPLPIAIRLLAGSDDEKLSDVELIELLSEKIGNYLKSSKELVDVISEFAKKSGVPDNKEKEFTDTTVELIASTVRNNIQYDKWVYEVIRSAKQIEEESGNDERTKSIVKKFFSYRLYDRPGDEIVRTGDIIRLHDEGKEDVYPDLYLVLTPTCDLAHFWRKTRGTLTVIKLEPILKDRGIRKVNSYGIKIREEPNSITNRNPFVFPSLHLNSKEPMDYVLFVHEVEHLKFNGEELKTQTDLTYAELAKIGVKITRECRVSEPFLKGILSEIRNVLFRDGVPDFPREEKARLLESLKQ